MNPVKEIQDLMDKLAGNQEFEQQFDEWLSQQYNTTSPDITELLHVLRKYYDRATIRRITKQLMKNGKKVMKRMEQNGSTI